VLRIEILKQADGSGLLRCTREDGSVTWQKQVRHGAHFALHDLTHYAVESALGFHRGFFGLIAEGWEIDDTTGKGPRGALPPDAIEVERIVGLFDSERAAGLRWSLAEFNEFAPRKLTDADLEAVRSRRAELFARWSATPVGQSLALTFDIPEPG
jgi:hypothetical protein